MRKMYKLVVTLILFMAFSAFAEEVPAVQPEPAAPSEPVAQPEPAVNPEPVAQTEAVAQPESAATPEPVAQPTAATEPVASPEPVAQPEPAVKPEVAATPAPATKPEPVAKTDAPQQSASIFVQDPAVFRQRQADLEKLKKSVEGKNEGLDSLLLDASRIAKMNDQCAAVSINDVMGEECWTFYRVELPAFEEKYMHVTGEVRLGHMETARGLEDRKLQIDACVEALYSFAQSKDQFLNLDGGVNLEPLRNGFQANFDFTLQYEPNHRKHAFEIAQKWGETCREMVVRKDGEGFAPFFLDLLGKLNEELANNGSLAVYKTDTSAAPVLFMDISKPVRSAYYLNGVKLFHSRISAGPVSESPVRIHFEKGAVMVDGEPVVMKRGEPQKFKGSVEYPQKEAALNGRWIWENQGNNEGVDFGPEEDEVERDSLKAVEQARIAADLENRKGLHFSPWVGISSAFAPFNDKNYKAFAIDKGKLIILSDFTAAARLKFVFGENADMFAAFGAGAFVGVGIADELLRVYITPVAQAEFGYKKFGIRETAVIAIPKEDSEEWTQFRTGVFFGLGMFGIEAGYDFITNLGQGGYVTLFWNL